MQQEVPSSGSVRIAMDANQRSGILTLASVQTVLGSSSDPDRERPVRRAIVIFENLLCSEAGLPSGLSLEEATDRVEGNIANFDSLTIREQSEAVMQQAPSCVACHAQFMPYGYLSSHYSALGEYRDTQKGRPINAVAAAILDGETQQYQNVVGFASDLVDSEQFRSCAAGNIAEFLMGDHAASSFQYIKNAINSDIRSDVSFMDILTNTLSDKAFYLRRGQ